ncbi:Ppx/GppA phosphatase family protein [Corynebacterium falsenii]
MTSSTPESAQRFAAIDCGTNSIRLLIAERTADGSIRELNRDNIIVRLGQGVDASGRFVPEALSRVDAALSTYTDRMVDFGVVDVMMGATSATRDAHNRDEFFDITARHLGRVKEGAVAEVITGEREAELSFAGAVTDLPGATERNVCVIDLGGGSTEFVVHGPGREPQAYSADMGCVRLTERFLHSQPPTEDEIDAAREYVDGLMDVVASRVELGVVEQVVGVAGTMTTLSAITQGLDSYQPEKIHMSTLSFEDFRATARELLGRTPEQRCEFGPMHPGRADVIGGGAIVVDAFTTLFLDEGLVDITVSEKDILDGILAEVVARNS